MKAGSFAIFAPAMLLACASLAAAQQPPPLPPPPTASLPPAPAALAVPNPLAGLHPGPTDMYRSPDGSDRFQHGARYPAPPPPIVPFPGVVYFPGPYYYPGPFGYAHGMPYYETSMAETYRRSMAETYRETYRQRQREAARGGLVLESVPGMAQVFVDGNYVGLAEEFGPGGRAINLDPGAHRIELRAPGYETLVFNVMIEPNGVVRYRADMQPIATKPAAATAPPQPTAVKSFYIIPNCYAGDKPPSGTLPKGCDLKNLRRF